MAKRKQPQARAQAQTTSAQPKAKPQVVVPRSAPKAHVPPTQDPAPTPAPTPSPVKKGEDTNHLDNLKEYADSKLVRGIAMILAGAGIIGLVVAFGPVPILELISFGAMVTLPILALLFAAGLVSAGTIQIIWNFGLAEAVRQRVTEIRAAQTA